MLSPNHFFRSLTTTRYTFGLPQKWFFFLLGVSFFVFIYGESVGLTLLTVVFLFAFGKKKTKEDPRFMDVYWVKLTKLKHVLNGGRFNA